MGNLYWGTPAEKKEFILPTSTIKIWIRNIEIVDSWARGHCWERDQSSSDKIGASRGNRGASGGSSCLYWDSSWSNNREKGAIRQINSLWSGDSRKGIKDPRGGKGS